MLPKTLYANKDGTSIGYFYDDGNGFGEIFRYYTHDKLTGKFTRYDYPTFLAQDTIRAINGIGLYHLANLLDLSSHYKPKYGYQCSMGNVFCIQLAHDKWLVSYPYWHSNKYDESDSSENKIYPTLEEAIFSIGRFIRLVTTIDREYFD